MPYRYTTFNGIVLPAAMPEDDLGTPQAPSTIVDSLAGGVDFLGNNRYLPKRHNIRYRGMYTQTVDYLVDEAGNYIVDEAGNNIVTADPSSVLRARIDDIKAQHGKRGYLVRRREDDGAEHYKYARLLAVDHVRTLKDTDQVARLELTFEAEGRPWRSTFGTEASNTCVANNWTLIPVVNAGAEDVRDAVISVTASSLVGAVHVVAFIGDLIHYLSYTGAIAAGNTLVIDTGAHTVKNNGLDAYANFQLSPGNHNAPDWLLFPGGGARTDLLIYSLGSNSFASVTYAEQFP